MPDISMCKNEECDKKDNCYRYTAMPDYMQSYIMECNNYELFMPNETVALGNAGGSDGGTNDKA